MAKGGDILAVQQESERPFSIDQYMDGRQGSSVTVLTSRGANHKIYVQWITISVTNHGNANSTISVTDSASPAVLIAQHIDQVAGAGVPSITTFNFSPHGAAITAAKDLIITNTATANLIALVHIEGYEKLNSTISTATANTAN